MKFVKFFFYLEIEKWLNGQNGQPKTVYSLMFIFDGGKKYCFYDGINNAYNNNFRKINGQKQRTGMREIKLLKKRA